MRYQVLASDYDGTLAHDGHVSKDSVAALHRLRDSGRKLLLVTGRELHELKAVFPRIDLCDLVVAENGGLLYWPSEDREQVLAEPPPEEMVAELRRRNVTPFAVGRVILATWTPYETTVLEIIRDLGLEYQVIFNKGAVMALPSGTNKASGLEAALKVMQLSPCNTVGVGDAENDHAFLQMCECSVAVANALPAVKERCDWVTEGDHGRGVMELIDRLIANDLTDIETQGCHHPRRELQVAVVAVEPPP